MPKTTPPMPHSRSRLASNTAPSSPRFRPQAPPCAPWRNLWRLVGDTVRLPHCLTRALNNSFPQVLQGGDDTATPLFGDFLRRWPTRKAAPLARRSPLEAFCRAPPGRSADLIATRLPAIQPATALTTAQGMVTPHALLGPALVAPLRVTLRVMADVDTASAQQAQGHPAWPWLDALPGAGAVFAPRLLVALGAQRARYTSADARQKYAGIAPGTERSGKQSGVHWRLQWPTCLRQTCRAWAAASIRPSFWAPAYDQQQRDKGQAQQAAVRALACQWIRILSRCWQDRTPYDEAVALQARKRRSAPLLHNLAH
jgi:hypothetical protein